MNEDMKVQPIVVTGTIFQREAPHYFKLGIPVMPLKPQTKIPLPVGWSNWADEHPLTEEIKRDWLRLPSNNNIGLILGAQSGIAIVDIDIKDSAIVEQVIAKLPKSPWHRFGRKGLALAYKHNPNLRSFKIIDPKEGSLIEYLSSGNQVVLPPSIHPDTLQPYKSNSDLFQVVDQLNILPDDFERICREVLMELGYDLKAKSSVSAVTDFVPAGNRDNTMIRIVGMLSQDILAGRISLRRAFDTLEVKSTEFMEQVEGDAIDLDKHCKHLIKFLIGDAERSNRLIPPSWSEGLSPEDIKRLPEIAELQAPDYDELAETIELEKDNSASDPVVAIETILRSMAKMTNVSEVREEKLLRELAAEHRDMTSFASLRRQLNHLRHQMETVVTDVETGSEIELISHTEIARAAISHYNQFGELRSEAGILYSWRGSHWGIENPDAFMAQLSVRYIKCETMRRHSDVLGVFKQILMHTSKRLRQNNEIFINVANGVVLQNGNLVPHDPDFGATYVMPYRYIPSKAGKCPTFFKFLKDAWGTDPDCMEKIKALQEAIAVSLAGYATRFQRVFLLIGKARTGKSVMLETVSSLFPDEASASVSFHKLQENRHMVSLDKKLLNIVGELSEKKPIAGDVFKATVDGSPISCYRLYQESFNLTPVAAHWAASNHLPKTADSSQGFTRRWLMFKFENQLPEEMVDINLKDKIIAEREAIFAWALESLPEVLARGNFTLPSSHKRLIAALTYQVNPVQLYLERRGGGTLEFAPELKIGEDELWIGFRAFYTQVSGSSMRMDISSFRQMVEEIQSEFKIRIEEPKNSLHAIYHGIGPSDDRF